MICQQERGELAAGRARLQECALWAGAFARRRLSVEQLVVGLKCGGSDGLSGITANPVVGHVSDLLCAMGATAVLTEVPEMFGAEQMLLGRCQTPEIYEKAVEMLQGFKAYFIAHNEVVYENPSPGNKQGGITTLEDKSCGCVQKGGSATNSGLYLRKGGWLDFNAGSVATSQQTIQDAGNLLFEKVLAVASGEQTCSELHGYREISIFKDGVVL